MKGFGGGFGNMQNLMKQAQQMQKQMQEAQEQLEQMEIEGESGNGMVKVYISGKKVLNRISIDKKIVDPDDVEILEDLICAAFNDANAKADEANEGLMGQFGGLL